MSAAPQLAAAHALPLSAIETPAVVAPDAAERFARIDQVRGFAVTSVVLCHMAVSAYDGAPNLGPEPLPWLGQVLGFGYLGVALFFVVSGFCIHWPEARARGARRPLPAPRWGDFFRRRFWRLYPPYVAALVSAVLLLRFATGAWPVGVGPLLAEFALVQTLDPRTFLGANPPAWTLAVEAQLYLAYPIVLLLARRFGPWRAAATVLAATMTYRVGLAVAPLPADYKRIGWELFLGRWFEWTAGAFVAEWAAGNVRLPGRLASWWLAVPLVLVTVYLGEWHFWHWGLYVVREPLYGLAFALLLLTVLATPKERRPSRLALWLGGVGLWSYSLYLVHRPVQLAFEPLARRLAASPFVVAHGIPSSLLLLAATTPLVFGVGRLFHRWCEEPAFRKARSIGRAPTRTPATTAPTQPAQDAGGDAPLCAPLSRQSSVICCR